MKIAEMLVQDGELHDDILHKPSLPVNMRLYKENKEYHSIILDIIDYMMFGANFEFEDYPTAQGVSGANVGIPFNIVVVVAKDAHEVFINPEIRLSSKEMVECNSNCGSINLAKKIKVMRHRWVRVAYYNTSGVKLVQTFTIGDDDPVSSATLQHEIEHNLGILITDKKVKKKK